MDKGKIKATKLVNYLQSSVASFPKPSSSLEQYVTPPNIAADLLIDINMRFPLKELVVGDICCGTGMLSMAAYCLGARVRLFIRKCIALILIRKRLIV